jgi:predicted DsbA family dithiol-disulfide isomerase
VLPIRIDYYLDALSQWCFIGDKALRNIQMRYANQLHIRYRFVPICGRGPIYVDSDGQRMAYERSESISGVHTTVWLQGEARSTWQANAAILAACSLGIDIERARNAISTAALEHAAPLGENGEAATLIATRFGIDRQVLEAAMNSQAICEQMDEDARAFTQNGCTLRPAFVLENDIGDRTVLNGGWRESLLAEVVDALLSDAAGYEWYEKHLSPSRP